jgi:A/G-specific adenine glycosylase
MAFSFEPLLSWFAVAKRAFPWREDVRPYSVLVSEVMLQQTQALRVVDYFVRWMKGFTSLQSLSEAEEERVIKAWEGLGYYSRARSLHSCAKIVCSEFGGVLPFEKKDLLRLPGIGPYTAGAIASFAYHQRCEAIDANVRRVMCRLVKGCFEYGAEGVVERMLPEAEPWVAMESLIELGALVCTKVPFCEQCPCKTQCYAYSSGRSEELTKRSTSSRISLWRDVAIFVCRSSVLVIRSAKHALMRGLYEFPYYPTKVGGRTPLELIREEVGCLEESMTFLFALSKTQHSFTKYQAHLYPVAILAKDFFHTIEEGEWVPLDKLSSLPFSSGHRRVLMEFLKKYQA